MILDLRLTNDDLQRKKKPQITQTFRLRSRQGGLWVKERIGLRQDGKNFKNKTVESRERRIWVSIRNFGKSLF